MKYYELPQWLQTLIAKTVTPNMEEGDYLLAPDGSFAMRWVVAPRELGIRWLDTQSDLQRALSVARAQMYAVHMDNGQWYQLPNAVMIFDRNARGVNGKTTLAAFKLSHADTLTMLVAYGVPKEALRTMDGIRPRSTVQGVKMAEETDKFVQPQYHGMLKVANELLYDLEMTNLPRQVDALLLHRVVQNVYPALKSFEGIHDQSVRRLQREEWGVLLVLHRVDPELACHLARLWVARSQEGIPGHYSRAREQLKAVGSSGASFAMRSLTMMLRVFRAELEKRSVSESAVKRRVMQKHVEKPTEELKWLKERLLSAQAALPVAAE